MSATPFAKRQSALTMPSKGSVSASSTETSILDAQTLLASIALGRATPFGVIPPRRSTLHSEQKSRPQRKTSDDHLEMNVKSIHRGFQPRLPLFAIHPPSRTASSTSDDEVPVDDVDESPVDEDAEDDEEASQSSREEDDDEAESSDHSTRGRRRSSSRCSRRTSSSPDQRQQCAIGLFSSPSHCSLTSPFSSSKLRRSRSGRDRVGGDSAQSRADRGIRGRDVSPREDEPSTPVLRVRSSPNLASMKLADDPGSDSRQGADERCSRRGREGSVKRVPASSGIDRNAASRRSSEDIRHSIARIRAANMRRTASVSLTAATIERYPSSSKGIDDAFAVSPDEVDLGVMKSWESFSNQAEGTFQVEPSTDIRRVDASSKQVTVASSSSPPVRAPVPLVGAENIYHLAGQPSMVSNGAHLLMLSLELEMIRRHKITGSLKPRWLKARMRTEPFQSAEQSDEVAEQPSQHSSPHAKHARHSHPHPHHEHRAHIGLHTSHHVPHHHHRRHSHPAHRGHASFPRRGSGLRFEVMPSASSV